MEAPEEGEGRALVGDLTVGEVGAPLPHPSARRRMGVPVQDQGNFFLFGPPPETGKDAAVPLSGEDAVRIEADQPVELVRNSAGIEPSSSKTRSSLINSRLLPRSKGIWGCLVRPKFNHLKGGKCGIRVPGRVQDFPGPGAFFFPFEFTVT